MRISGKSAGPDWESDLKEKRVGPCNSQHSDLGRPSSFLQHPRSTPSQSVACLSAEPRWRCSLTRELGGVQICLIWDIKWGTWPCLTRTPRSYRPAMLKQSNRQSQLTTEQIQWHLLTREVWQPKQTNAIPFSLSLSFFLTSFSSRIPLKYDLIDSS